MSLQRADSRVSAIRRRVELEIILFSNQPCNNCHTALSRRVPTRYVFVCEQHAEPHLQFLAFFFDDIKMCISAISQHIYTFLVAL